jgi:hypothetical protein
LLWKLELATDDLPALPRTGDIRARAHVVFIASPVSEQVIVTSAATECALKSIDKSNHSNLVLIWYVFPDIPWQTRHRNQVAYPAFVSLRQTVTMFAVPAAIANLAYL